MANNHGYVSTARTMSQDVDALNRVGIYDTADLDNGVLVNIVKMVQATEGNAEGFQYEVAPATTADNEDIYIVDTPEVGSDILMQEYSDPRYFFNAKGRPLAIKKLIANVDEIEVDANCFVGQTLPTTTNKYIKPATGGKLEAASANTGACFELVALHHIAIGMEVVNTAIIKFVGKLA